MKKYILSIILFLALVIHSPVLAAEPPSSLSIHPSIISLVLAPGTTSTTSLSIKNNGDVPLPVRIQFEPLILTSDTHPLQSIGSWIHISDPTLLIPAKKETNVTIKVTLPKTIPLGGYYGMLYVEPFSASANTSSSLILTRVGVLLLGSVGVQEVPLNSIELLNPTINTYVSETSTLHLSFDVKNTALNHISAKPYLVVRPLSGALEEFQFDERLVFPGTTRNWESSFTVQNDRAFFYTADLFVSIGNGRFQKKSFSFIIFPIKQAIIAVLLLAIGLSIIRKRTNIKKAMQIILSG